MSVGLGIFLGSVFCGLVYLYTKNPDRWNARKIVKILALTLGSVLLLVAIALGANSLISKYNNRPVVTTEFQGVKVGEQLKDFVFKSGASKNADWKNNNPEKYPLESDGAYNLKTKGDIVMVSNGIVENIEHVCDADTYDGTSLNGVKCEDTGEDLVERFKGLIEVVCPKKGDPYENTVRIYSVNKYGLQYFLFENRVKAQFLSAPGSLKSTNGYSDCGNERQSRGQ